MTSSVRSLRVFLSSPGDVVVERGLADDILGEISRSPAWRGKFTFEIVRWDDPHAQVPMDAHLSPQDAINQHLPRPSECEIVAVILWSRFGTPLSEPLKPDGTPYLSGTEWEFHDALAGDGRLLLFRRLDEPRVSLADPEYERKAEQYRRVVKFFQSFATDTGAYTRSMITYEGEQGFASTFRQAIEGVLRHLETAGGTAGDGVNIARLRTPEGEPELPDSPYPLLQPYVHPDTFAGRDEELHTIEHFVRRQRLVLGVYAVSGAGKSSLLLAGLVPRLRAAGFPVSIERRPGEPGLARRLLDDLLILPPDVHIADDSDGVCDEFARWIGHARTLAGGRPPVLILDQIDDVLRLPDSKRDEVLARLGPLVAATARRLPGDGGFPCRWLFCYRQEFHGDVGEWLQDVLKQARSAGRGGLDALPHNLAGELFDSWAVPVMGAVRGGDGGQPDAARDAFLRAITQPLELRGRDGVRRYTFRFHGNGAERLADAFARARVAQPKAPLVPELQVVLSHLIGRAVPDPDGTLLLNVPDDPGELDQQIDDALAAHLSWAIEEAFPLGRNAAVGRASRARALLVLRELVDAHGRRGPRLTKEALAAMFGEDGDRVISAMESPQVRLIVQERRAHAFVYALSHDRMAEVITRFFESESLLGDLDLDSRVVELRRFVAQRSELYLRSNDRNAIDLTTEQHELIQGAAAALIRDDGHRRWWEHCQVWFDLRQQLGADPPDFLALVRLARGYHGDWGQIGRRLPAADINPRIFWAGPWDADRSQGDGGLVDPAEVLDVVECAHTVLLDSREAFYALGYAVEEIRWRFPAYAARAQELRARLHEAFGAEYGPDHQLPFFRPDLWYLPDEALLGFVRIPGGTLSMGSDKALDPLAYDDEVCGQGQGPVELSDFYIGRYEVTVAQFRTFVSATGLVPGDPEGLNGPPQHPVTRVSWNEAARYCAWLEHTLTGSSETPEEIRELLRQGWRVSLASEAEWERAARGADTRTYPWGEGIDAGRANFSGARVGGTSSVGSFPQGASPYGVLDLSGNVWEWTRSRFVPYPYDPADGREDDAAEGDRVLRGGYFGSHGGGVRIARRHHRSPDFRDDNVGFRVVISRI